MIRDPQDLADELAAEQDAAAFAALAPHQRAAIPLLEWWELEEDPEENLDQALLAECEAAIARGEVDVDAPIPYALTARGRAALRGLE